MNGDDHDPFCTRIHAPLLPQKEKRKRHTIKFLSLGFGSVVKLTENCWNCSDHSDWVLAHFLFLVFPDCLCFLDRVSRVRFS